MGAAVAGRGDLDGAAVTDRGALQLAEVFTAEVAAIARFLPGERARTEGDAAGHDPLAVAGAVGAALADDLAPLADVLGLVDPEVDPWALTARLDDGLRTLDAVRRLTLRRLPVRAVATVEEVDQAFATVARQLAVQATATAAARTAAAVDRSVSGSSSMAVTMHELRRPLSVLTAYAQLLEGGALGELDQRGRDAARSMVAAGESMYRLVESLAAVARLEDPNEMVALRDVDVTDIVAAALRDAETEATLKSVSFDVEVAAGTRVRGDRERLALALTNLVSNAVKHSPADAAVLVRADVRDGAVHIVVRDHGPGFPPGTAERLFEKYYRDEQEKERGIPGTGLGLFIVTTVAERHGGRVEARAADGGGAEFELTVPAIPDREEERLS